MKQITVKGIVVDGIGEPVIGASVVLKGNCIFCWYANKRN